MKNQYIILLFTSALFAAKKETKNPVIPSPTKDRTLFLLPQDRDVGNAIVAINNESKLVKDFISSQTGHNPDSCYAIFTLNADASSFSANGKGGNIARDR